MKIYSNYLLDGYPKAEHIVDWNYDEEDCSDHVYLIRLSQSEKPDTWFRSLRLIEQIERFSYGRPYLVYHVSYERKYEYWSIEIADGSEALAEFMDKFDGFQNGLTYKDGKFWFDYMGE